MSSDRRLDKNLWYSFQGVTFSWPAGPQNFHPVTMAQFVRSLAEKAPVLVNAAVTHSKPRLATLWHYAKVELQLIASNSSQLRKLCRMAWWPLRCGCGFTSARSQAHVASLARMFEDQSLTSISFWFII